jgi:hypothetical protein
MTFDGDTSRWMMPRFWPLSSQVVGVVEGLAQVDQHRQHQRHRHRAGRVRGVAQDLAQVLAVDQLHRDEVLAADAAEVVGLRDVDVAELRGEAGLAHERADELLVGGEGGQEALQRDLALEALDAALLGAEDLGHATDAEALEDLVVPEHLGRLRPALTPTVTPAVAHHGRLMVAWEPSLGNVLCAAS